MDKHTLLRINLLGKPEVWLEGKQLTSFSTAKTQALFFYLAATGQVHSRDSLAGLLWGEMPESNARRNLTKSLGVLRKLIEPYLLIESNRVGFDQDKQVECDIHQFAQAIVAGSPSQETIALYRGDFLEGFFVKDAFAFEAWQLTERERLREMMVSALEDMVAQASGRGDYATGIALCRRLLALDPWREGAHRQLMLLLARHGQPGAALAQYDHCRQVLADELGVDPLPETTALYERLLTSRSQPAYHLPAPATPLYGRQAELRQIGRMLADPECRLLTLVGLGGMGKTRLALAVAQQANQEQAVQFLNGVAFVDLTSVPAADMLPQALADTLAFPLAGGRKPVEQLGQFLRDREMLLVLDNFEHLVGGAGIIARLLQAAPDIKFLVTSRELLLLQAEHRFDVDGLPFPPAGQQNTGALKPDMAADRAMLAAYPAVNLFVQTARQGRPKFSLSPENAGHVIRICQVLSGVPLAIKLAASWLRVMGSADVLAEIEHGLDLLTTSLRDVPSRQRSMVAVFEHSWEMLTPPEQTCFAALSVFSGGFTAQAARVISNASSPLLAGLVDRALLNIRQTDQGVRYWLHELTRQFAAVKLSQTPVTAGRIHDAHAGYYTRQMAGLIPEFNGQTPRPAYGAVHREIGNVRAAWQHAIDQRNLEILTVLMEPLFWFYARQGWFLEGREQFGQVVDLIAKIPQQNKTALRLLGGVLARQGGLISRIGQFAEGEAALRQSLEIARQIADPHLLAFALLELGGLLRDQSRFAEARAIFQECYDIAEELNDGLMIAQAIEKLGVVTWDQGSHVEARDRLQEALGRFRDLQNTGWTATTLNSLGNVTMSMGDDQTALAYYEEALPISRELGNQLFLDTVLLNLGMVNNNMGDFAQSRRYYEESLEICRRIGDEIGVAYCLTGIGQACAEEGDLVQARRLLEQSLALNRTMKRDRYVGINLNLLGDLDMLEEKYAIARARYEESLVISEQIPHSWGVASSHQRLGDLDYLEGNFAEAARHILDALKINHEIESFGGVYNALKKSGAYLLEREKVEPAVLAFTFLLDQPTLTDSIRRETTDLLAEAADMLPEENGKGLKQAQSLDEIIAVVAQAIETEFFGH